MPESQYDKLPRDIQKRHFASERGNGKGDHKRAGADDKAYKDGWDRIWGKKAPKKQEE